MAKAANKRKTVAERVAAAAPVTPQPQTIEEIQAAIAALGGKPEVAPAPVAHTAPAGTIGETGMPNFAVLGEAVAAAEAEAANPAPAPASTEAPVDWSKVAKAAETPFYDSATGTGPATADGPATQRVEEPAAEPTPAPAASNTNADIKGFMKEVAKLGGDYGSGVNSLPALALRTLQAYPQVPELAKAKASTILGAFNVAAGKKAGIEHKSAGVQASKFNQFLEVAKLGATGAFDAYDMMGKAVSVIQEVAKREKSPLRGSTYENMVLVCRAQKSVPTRELTAAEMEAAILPDKKEKDEVEKLGDLFKSLRKAHDWASSAAKPDIEDAYHALESAIKALGGTVPEVKSEEA